MIRQQKKGKKKRGTHSSQGTGEKTSSAGRREKKSGLQDGCSRAKVRKKKKGKGKREIFPLAPLEELSLPSFPRDVTSRRRLRQRGKGDPFFAE